MWESFKGKTEHPNIDIPFFPISVKLRSVSKPKSISL